MDSADDGLEYVSVREHELEEVLKFVLFDRQYKVEIHDGTPSKGSGTTEWKLINKVQRKKKLLTTRLLLETLKHLMNCFLQLNK